MIKDGDLKSDPPNPCRSGGSGARKLGTATGATRPVSRAQTSWDFTMLNHPRAGGAVKMLLSYALGGDLIFESGVPPSRKSLCPDALASHGPNRDQTGAIYPRHSNIWDGKVSNVQMPLASGHRLRHPVLLQHGSHHSS